MKVVIATDDNIIKRLADDYDCQTKHIDQIISMLATKADLAKSAELQTVKTVYQSVASLKAEIERFVAIDSDTKANMPGDPAARQGDPAERVGLRGSLFDIEDAEQSGRAAAVDDRLFQDRGGCQDRPRRSDRWECRRAPYRSLGDACHASKGRRAA